MLGHLGKPAAHLEVLTRGYRVPAEVLAFAGRLLPELTPATSARTVPGSLAVVPLTRDRRAAAVLDHTRAALAGPGSLAVIAADADLPDLDRVLRAGGLALPALAGHAAPERACLVPASLAKGLEFDTVIVVEPAAIVAGESQPRQGLRRLYVVLTRAVGALTVLHAEALPPALREWDSR